MPDITMCSGDDCPLKEDCFRYYAKPDKHQSYFMGTPFYENKCGYFI